MVEGTKLATKQGKPHTHIHAHTLYKSVFCVRSILCSSGWECAKGFFTPDNSAVNLVYHMHILSLPPSLPPSLPLSLSLPPSLSLCRSSVVVFLAGPGTSQFTYESEGKSLTYVSLPLLSFTLLSLKPAHFSPFLLPVFRCCWFRSGS